MTKNTKYVPATPTLHLIMMIVIKINSDDGIGDDDT